MRRGNPRVKSIVGKERYLMYKYFKVSEFDSPDEAGSGEMMEPAVIEALDVARDLCGFPLIITSGFRTIKHHEWLTKQGYPTSKNSSHLLGWAADIACSNSARRYLLIEALLDAGFTRIGIGKTYLHVDLDTEKPSNRIWVY